MGLLVGGSAGDGAAGCLTAPADGHPAGTRGRRRTATTAAHLLDRVLPAVRLRQCVVTPPAPSPLGFTRGTPQSGYDAARAETIRRIAEKAPSCWSRGDEPLGPHTRARLAATFPRATVTTELLLALEYLRRARPHLRVVEVEDDRITTEDEEGQRTTASARETVRVVGEM